MLAPYVVAFVVFMVAPSVYGLYLSFTDYRLGAVRVHWIGWENFSYVPPGPRVHNSAKNTLILVLESTPLLIALPPLLALALEPGVPPQDFLHGTLFLPLTLPVFVL